MYRELDAARIQETVRLLAQRINERFPDSGLARVAQALVAVARDTITLVEELRRPHRLIRATVALLIVALLALVGAALASLRVSGRIENIGALLQAIEAGVNDVVFTAIAIWFLATLEGRLKRRRALRAIHELRSLAHIVDMHQLTKDPEQLLTGGPTTPSSPSRRHMSRFELSRYLDYCTELLSLTSKLAALYVQGFHDPHVLNAVNDVQTLTTGLASKIWQKIMILDAAVATPNPTPAS